MVVALARWVPHADIKTFASESNGLEVANDLDPSREQGGDGEFCCVDDAMSIVHRDGSVDLQVELHNYPVACVPGANVVDGTGTGAG